MATGILVLAIGEATKLVPYLTGADKAYEATLALGVETDTLDAEGVETRRAPVPDALVRELKSFVIGAHSPRLSEALTRERARTQQIPPIYSAIQQDGERAYARARRGEDVILEPRDVKVRDLAVVAAGVEPSEWLALKLEVAKGYYVRSLGRDLAEHLGTVGHLTDLRRTRSGTFSLSDALDLESDPDTLRAHLIPLARAAARALPVLSLNDTDVGEARFGRPLRPESLVSCGDGPHAWLGPDGVLVAIGARGEDGRGRVLRGFAPPPAAEAPQ